ncbi:hypothetical protein CCHR01_20015 [Colletotrichum chrysophilum]|uniref:Uncharacterized protein n=1 Tax=Colletotrichum chrysophilum TaxID=1836956 RepID=A0AAD8ZXK2_9PEZI|nr:hypothetical protein CCHR01_20015 [Colletotrichum chrysophilum]
MEADMCQRALSGSCQSWRPPFCESRQTRPSGTNIDRITSISVAQAIFTSQGG